MNGRPWRPEEDNLLRAFFASPDCPFAELASTISRSVGAVKQRASVLNLRLSPEVRSEISRRNMKARHERDRRVVSLTPFGRKLYPLVERLWGSPSACYEAGGIMGYKAFTGLLSDPDFIPGIGQLQRLHTAIVQKQRERGEKPIAKEQILGPWVGKTLEDVQRSAPVPRRCLCRICERPLPRGRKKTCSLDCDAIRRILNKGIPLAGGQYIFTIMGLSADLAPERIAFLLKIPKSPVKAWASQPRVFELASDIKALRERAPRKERSPGITMLVATAKVLKIGINTLERHLHHKYRFWRPNGSRTRAHRFSRHLVVGQRSIPLSLWQTLGLTGEEYMRMFGLEKLFSNQARETAQRARRTRLHRYGYKATGRFPTDCAFYDAILARLDGDIYDAGPNSLREEWRAIYYGPGRQAASFNEPSDVRWGMIEHARICPRHRRKVVVYLRRVEEEDASAIADLLGNISSATVYRILAAAHPLEFRLTSGEVAKQWEVNRRTVTKWAASEIIETVHLGGRWWAFPRRVLTKHPPSIAS